MRKKFISSLLILFCFTISLSQSTYKKKVVSYVDKVLVNSSYGLNIDQRNTIVSTLSKSVAFERFNYAALPSNIIDKFSSEASQLSSYSAESVRPIIEKTLAPELIQLLDLNKELLSKQNLSEADRNTFLATKAKAAGLNASQLEAIINSGFFYVPYVEYYKRSTERKEREIKDDKGKVVRKVKYTEFTHEIKTGLLWYKVHFDRGNTATVVYVGAAKGWDGDEISRTNSQDDGEDNGADVKAFEEVVAVSGVNIANETKKIEAFILTGGVTEVTTFGLNLNLGNREGLGLDDTYWVEEEMETESGEVMKEKRGFVKVREIGNNKSDESAYSYAQVITGMNYSPGLSVTELPLLGVNGVIGFGQMPLSISEFQKNKNGKTINGLNAPSLFGLSKFDFAANVSSEVKNTFGPMISVQTDLANSTKISELWLQFGAAIGFINVDGKFYFPNYNSSGNSIAGFWRDSADIGLSLTGNASLGLVKKFYFRRFGVILEGDFKYFLTHFSATGKDKNDDDLKYSLSHDAFGFGAKAGMEVYITPTFSIGGGIDYIAAGTGDTWTVAVEDKDKNETKDNNKTGPMVNYSGIGWFAWINYSLPSLK